MFLCRPAGSVSHVIFSEDNKQLIASVKGIPPTPGILAVWDIAADGSLSQDFQAVQPATGGLLPFSMTVIPGKNAILATDAGLGVDVFDVCIVDLNARDTALILLESHSSPPVLPLALPPESPRRSPSPARAPPAGPASARRPETSM